MNALIAEIVDKHGTPASFAQASTFVHQGIQMPFMYYLVSGKVKIEQSVVNGKSLLFSFTCAGSWLGDLELFSDTELANSTVTAVSDVETMRFPIELMRQNLKVYPGLSELFARSLAKKMWAYSKLSTVNLLYPLLDRYAAYLYEMSAYSSELPIALETSAGLLGAGERQLQRVLRILAERGIIQRSGRTLTVVDRNGLRRLANELVQDGAN